METKRQINARKARGKYIPDDFDHTERSLESLKIAISMETEHIARWKPKWGKVGSLITANLASMKSELEKRQGDTDKGVKENAHLEISLVLERELGLTRGAAYARKIGAYPGPLSAEYIAAAEFIESKICRTQAISA